MPDIYIAPNSDSVPAPAGNGADLSKLPLKINKTKGLFRQGLSPFLFMPENIRFETQNQAETIILILRKHWWTNFIWLAVSILLIVSPLILFPGLMMGGIITESVPASVISFFILLWYLFVFSYMLVNFLLWYFTVSIVTNERVVDIDFINILNKKFAATRITKVEDVTMKRGGIMRAIFDFGTVIIQTAAKEVEFYFWDVPCPEKVVRIINNLMGRQEDIHS